MTTILVLTDFSERAFRAGELALQLAFTNQKSLVLYHSIVLPEAGLAFGDRVFSDDDVSKRKAESMLKLEVISGQLKALSKERYQHEINIILHAGLGPVPESIVSLVKEYDVWMVAMGNRVAVDVKNLSFDSNILPVTNHAGCPVLLVP